MLLEITEKLGAASYTVTTFWSYQVHLSAKYSERGTAPLYTPGLYEKADSMLKERELLPLNSMHV